MISSYPVLFALAHGCPPWRLSIEFCIYLRDAVARLDRFHGMHWYRSRVRFQGVNSWKRIFSRGWRPSCNVRLVPVSKTLKPDPTIT